MAYTFFNKVSNKVELYVLYSQYVQTLFKSYSVYLSFHRVLQCKMRTSNVMIVIDGVLDGIIKRKIKHVDNNHVFHR